MLQKLKSVTMNQPSLVVLPLSSGLAFLGVQLQVMSGWETPTPAQGGKVNAVQWPRESGRCPEQWWCLGDLRRPSLPRSPEVAVGKGFILRDL